MRTVPVAMRSLLLILKLCTSLETVRRDRAPSLGTLRAVSFTSSFLPVLSSFCYFCLKRKKERQKQKNNTKKFFVTFSTCLTKTTQKDCLFVFYHLERDKKS